MKGKIFNAQEVQAIISGNKTQFREVKVRPNSDKNPVKIGFKFTGIWGGGAKESRRECPYQVGQKIFCKETFEIWDDGLVYKADNSPANTVSKWKPAQHMKQEHSRLILLIKEITVEKLSEISEKDLKLEGFKTDYKIRSDGIYKKDAIKFFQEEWNATHKKPEEKFEANPFVFVYTTEVVK
jgi:hypothetical protein